MSKLKYAKNHNKKSPFMAIVPQGNTLVEIVTSPKSLFSVFRKNSQDLKNNYKANQN